MKFELPTKLEILQKRLADLRLDEKIYLQHGDMGYASAPSNIALLKYWGKVPGKSQIPVNPSVSYTLGGFRSFTRVSVLGRFRPENEKTDSSVFENQISLGKNAAPEKASAKLDLFLTNLFSGWADDIRLSIQSINNFPTACGIASSASGYAALVGAVADLCQLKKHLSNEELQYWLCEWSRLGSGSATRSAILSDESGFISWSPSGTDDAGHFLTETRSIEAHGVFAGLRHCVIVVDEKPKDVSSSEGHLQAQSSPLQAIRCAGIDAAFSSLQIAIRVGDVSTLARITEQDAFDMHAVMQTGSKPVNYLKPLTVDLISDFVAARNKANAAAFWTLDAGPNPHILYLDSASGFMANWISKTQNRLGHSLKIFMGTKRAPLTLGKADTTKLESENLLHESTGENAKEFAFGLNPEER